MGKRHIAQFFFRISGAQRGWSRRRLRHAGQSMRRIEPSFLLVEASSLSEPRRGMIRRKRFPGGPETTVTLLEVPRNARSMPSAKNWFFSEYVTV